MRTIDARARAMTAISRKDLSAPVKWLIGTHLFWIKAHQFGVTCDKRWFPILDFGCGRGDDRRILKDMYGVGAYGYDPWWGPVQMLENEDGTQFFEDGFFKTILCTYVLNVVSKEEEDEILEQIRRLLHPKGRAYISVRRDREKKWGPEQRWSSPEAPDIESVYRSRGFEIYEMRKG